MRLGAFELGQFLARGGMGQVWSGRHVDRDAPVAIKVVHAEVARGERYVEAFRAEVRAVARLSHPSIVSVYDHGVVPDDVGDTGLSPGAPYLVMELVEGGSLDELCGTLPWDSVRQILARMLDGLAHAHARGVIHRDLKPANILVAGRLSPAVKITDFGIAHALDGDRDSWTDESAVGTPGYMAPEQLSGRWRDYGPWTDLYSLGRVAMAMVRAAPGSDAGVDVPDEFAPWIERLMQLSIARRFRRAADAAEALAAMGPPVSESGRRFAVDAEADTAAVDGPPDPGSMVTPEPLTRTTQVAAIAEIPIVGETAVLEDSCPPVPDDWRSGGRDSLPMAGAGLGLYGLRSVPVVGREAERDSMWTALRSAHRNQRAELVILRGPAGCGKSRLAQWLCERAHETGAGEILHAFHGSRPGPQDGIGAMIGRHFRCGGLRRAQVVERLESRLRQIGLRDPDDWLALTELIAPAAQAGDDVGPVVRFGSTSERHHLVRRLLTHVGRGRVAVVWIDDAHWGPDSLDLARRIMEDRDGAPILLIATVRDEALPSRPQEVQMLGELRELPGVRDLWVGPLGPVESERLVRRLLGLEASLAARVEAVTAGNPLFAVQIVGEWVQRGVLESSDAGFRLRQGISVQLPDDLHEVWAARVDRIVGDRDDDRLALEIAAVLGEEVDTREWTVACERAGVTPSSQLVESLLEERLARPHMMGANRGWSFVHGMLRESLERVAREAGRWAGYNEICAQVVAEADRRYAKERTGRYLIAAGRLEAGIALLTAAARDRDTTGDTREVRILLAERDAALDRMGVSELHALRLDGWLLWGSCCRAEGQLDEADRWARKVIDVGKRLGLISRVAEALLIRETVARYRGHLGWAWRRAREAERLIHAAGEVAMLSTVYREQAWILTTRGDLERAIEMWSLALAQSTAAGRDLEAGLCCNGLAVSYIQAARPGEARKLLSRALRIFREQGSRSNAGLALSSLGDVERLHYGNLDRAEELYRSSLIALTAVGYGQTHYCHINIGLTLIARGRYREAEPLLSRALVALEGQGVHAAVGAVNAMLLPCEAHSRHWQRFDDRIALAESHLESMTDSDVAGPAQLAGDIAAGHGEKQRARRAYELALAQWTAMGREKEAAAVRRALDYIDSPPSTSTTRPVK